MSTLRLFSILTIFLALVTLLHSSVIASDPFVGAETCGHCHKAQYEAWKNGPHSGSLFTLDLEHRKDPRCIGCHSATHSGAERTGVQCESCHGNGTHYSKSYIMKDRKLSEALGLKVKDYEKCLQCHQGDLPCIKEFDAKKDWKKLPHSKTSEKNE